MSNSKSEKKLAKFVENHKNFVLYGIIGITGVTLDYIVFTLLTKEVGMYILLANSISVTLGIINNFILNTLLNFKKKDKIHLRFLSFFLIGLFGLVLSSVILKIFVDVLGVNPLLTKLGSIILVVITQYLLNKKISFKDFGERVNE